MFDKLFISGKVNYVKDNSTTPCFYAYDNRNDSMPLQEYSVNITNARKLKPSPTLDIEGFQLVLSPTNVSDFWSFEEVNDVYAQEIEEIVHSLTGADNVIVTTIGNPRNSKASKSNDFTSVDKALHFVHADFSKESAWWWVEQILEKESFEMLKSKRLVIYGTWRCLSPPPQNVPFALCAANSISQQDVISADAIADYPGAEEIKWEAFMYKFNPMHEWRYFPNLTKDELILFKHFDSAESKATRCPHTAFNDDYYSSCTSPRLSIDTRVFAFFDD